MCIILSIWYKRFTLHFVHAMYLCVSYDSHKQQLQLKVRYLTLANPESSVNWKVTKRPTVPSTGSCVVYMMIKRVKYLCLVGSLGYIHTVSCIEWWEWNRNCIRENKSGYQVTHYMVRSVYKAAGCSKVPRAKNYDIQQPADPKGAARYRNLCCVSLNSINWLFFVMKMQYISCEARNWVFIYYLSKIHISKCCFKTLHFVNTRCVFHVFPRINIYCFLT
jgi:hypothetical protein